MNKKDEIVNYITSNLKYIRISMKLSQNKFADMIHVDQTTVARWEDENRKPSIDKAIEISNILNIPLDILTGKDFNSTNYDIFNNIDNRLKESINNLSNTNKELLISVANSMNEKN